jgi:hypothetical protein
MRQRGRMHIRAAEAGDSERHEGAFARALELLDLTLEWGLKARAGR